MQIGSKSNTYLKQICKIRPVYKVPSLHLLRGKNYSRKKKQHKSQENTKRFPNRNRKSFMIDHQEEQ